MWVILALLDPDPDSEYGSGSTDPIEYGSNTDPVPDPDPQPCVNTRNSLIFSIFSSRIVPIQMSVGYAVTSALP